MQIHTLQRHVKAAQLPLEQLASNAQVSQTEKLGEVSRQFEAILLRHVLSEAQKPVFKSKLSGPSMTGDIYRDLMTNELAEQISRSGSFGFARDLETQLHNQLKPAESPAVSTAPHPQRAASDGAASSSSYDRHP